MQNRDLYAYELSYAQLGHKKRNFDFLTAALERGRNFPGT